MKADLTTADVADLLGCCDSTVRKLAAAGKLPGRRPGPGVGRDWLFRPADVERFRRTPRLGPGRPKKTPN